VPLSMPIKSVLIAGKECAKDEQAKEGCPDWSLANAYDPTITVSSP